MSVRRTRPPLPFSVLALLVLPGRLHFYPGEPIQWSVRGCPGKEAIQIHRTRGPWLDGTPEPEELVYQGAPRLPQGLPAGLYRVTFQKGDCQRTAWLTVGALRVFWLAGTSRTQVLAFTPDLKPAGGTRFSVWKKGKPITSGLLPEAGSLLLPYPLDAEEVRFQHPTLGFAYIAQPAAPQERRARVWATVLPPFQLLLLLPRRMPVLFTTPDGLRLWQEVTGPGLQFLDLPPFSLRLVLGEHPNLQEFQVQRTPLSVAATLQGQELRLLAFQRTTLTLRGSAVRSLLLEGSRSLTLREGEDRIEIGSLSFSLRPPPPEEPPPGPYLSLAAPARLLRDLPALPQWVVNLGANPQVLFLGFREERVVEFLDPPAGGACGRARVLLPEAGTLWLTSPDFPFGLLVESPPAVATARDGVLPAPRLQQGSVYGVFRIPPSGELRVCFPPVRAVYRLTALPDAPTGTWRTMLTEIQDIYSARGQRVPQPPAEEKIQLEIWNLTPRAQRFLLRADLPVGVEVASFRSRRIERTVPRGTPTRLRLFPTESELWYADPAPALPPLPEILTSLLHVASRDPTIRLLAFLYRHRVPGGLSLLPGGPPSERAAALLAHLLTLRPDLPVDEQLVEAVHRSQKSLPAPRAERLPAYPSDCTVFPEDFLYPGDTDPETGCPLPRDSLRWSLSRKPGRLSLRLLTEGVPDALVTVNTRFCRETSWEVQGAHISASTGQAVVLENLAPEVTLQVSCQEGEPGQGLVWIPGIGGMTF